MLKPITSIQLKIIMNERKKSGKRANSDSQIYTFIKRNVQALYASFTKSTKELLSPTLWRRFIRTATKFCLFSLTLGFCISTYSGKNALYKTCTQTFTCMFIVHIHIHIYTCTFIVFKRRRNRDNEKKSYIFFSFF